MRHNQRIIFLVALIFACTLSLGCGNRSASDKPASVADPVTVTIIHPERKSLVRVVEQPGMVQAFEETQLFAKVGGYVSKINADIDQEVKGPKFDSAGRELEPGEILAEVAIPEMEDEAKHKHALIRQAEAEAVQARKALASAEANVAVAEATVTESKAGISRAQSHFDRWESEANRISGLVQKGVIDPQTRDETLNQFRAAQATREETKARVVCSEAAVRKAQTDRDKSEADVQAAEARIEVAKAEARRLETMLGYTKIRAPFDGIVTRRRINTGDYLRGNDDKGEGLFTVSRLDPVRLIVNVPEADAALVKKGCEASLTIPALAGPPMKGKVTRTSWALDPGSRTLRAEIDMPNPDGRLRPRMYVYAHLTGQLPEQLVLPSSAFVKQGDAMVCFIVEGDKAIRTPVRLGRSDGQFTEILSRQEPSSSAKWVEFTGKEAIAQKAAGLTDGMSVKVGASAK